MPMIKKHQYTPKKTNNANLDSIEQIADNILQCLDTMLAEYKECLKNQKLD